MLRDLLIFSAIYSFIIYTYLMVCIYFYLTVIIVHYASYSSWSCSSFYWLLILNNIKLYTQNDIVTHYTLCSSFSHAKTISFPQLTHLGENQKNWTRIHISVSNTKKNPIQTDHLHPRKSTILPQCTIAY